MFYKTFGKSGRNLIEFASLESVLQAMDCKVDIIFFFFIQWYDDMQEHNVGSKIGRSIREFCEKHGSIICDSIVPALRGC